MFPHSTDALAQAAGVAPSTVLKWHRLGFFADCVPQRTGDGKTTGAAYWWSDAAMARAAHIVDARARGFSMDEILRQLRAQPGFPAEKKRGR